MHGQPAAVRRPGRLQGRDPQLFFNYTKNKGLSLASSYPYHKPKQTAGCDQTKIKPAVTNTGFVSLPRNNYTALMSALVNVGPIAISLAAKGKGWQLYKRGVYDGNCGWVQDHAVGLVGYGSQEVGIIIRKKVDYWLVRNSWGERWGIKGYIHIKRFGEGKEPCGIDEHPSEARRARRFEAETVLRDVRDYERLVVPDGRWQGEFYGVRRGERSEGDLQRRVCDV